MMQFIYRGLAGVFSAVLSTIIVFIWKLFIGDGLQFIPITEFATPFIVAAAIGFVVGSIFYRLIGKLFSFLGHFGLEVN